VIASDERDAEQVQRESPPEVFSDDPPQQFLLQEGMAKACAVATPHEQSGSIN
jgi:hypothetical protein